MSGAAGDAVAVGTAGMQAWARRPNDWNGNLFVLGDLNLDRCMGMALRSEAPKCAAPSFELEGCISCRRRLILLCVSGCPVDA